jgi:hypothetical protein
MSAHDDLMDVIQKEYQRALAKEMREFPSPTDHSPFGTNAAGPYSNMADFDAAVEDLANFTAQPQKRPGT